MYSDDAKQEKWFEEHAVCLVDGAAGIYVPKEFVENYAWGAWGIAEEDMDILTSGPEHEHDCLVYTISRY